MLTNCISISASKIIRTILPRYSFWPLTRVRISRLKRIPGAPTKWGICIWFPLPLATWKISLCERLKVLRSVQRIAAEDTRTTRVLLSHYDIHTPLTSNQNWNEQGKIDELLSELALGDLAIVSDAGTPLINDPGYPVGTGGHSGRFPGDPHPRSFFANYCAIGIWVTRRSVYLPGVHSAQKQVNGKQFLQAAKDYPCTLVCLETPHRIVESLQAIQEILGDRSIAVCRELTKLYEEVIRGESRMQSTIFTDTNPGENLPW